MITTSTLSNLKPRARCDTRAQDSGACICERVCVCVCVCVWAGVCVTDRCSSSHLQTWCVDEQLRHTRVLSSVLLVFEHMRHFRPSVPGDIIIVEKSMCADSCSLTLKLKFSLPVRYICSCPPMLLNERTGSIYTLHLLEVIYRNENQWK